MGSYISFCVSKVASTHLISLQWFLKETFVGCKSPRGNDGVKCSFIIVINLLMARYVLEEGQSQETLWHLQLNLHQDILTGNAN